MAGLAKRERLITALTVGLLSTFVATAADYDLILDSYGEAELIAGLGQLEDVNGWEA